MDAGEGDDLKLVAVEVQVERAVAGRLLAVAPRRRSVPPHEKCPPHLRAGSVVPYAGPDHPRPWTRLDLYA